MKQKDDISQTDEPSSIVAGAVDKGRFAGVSKKRLLLRGGVIILAICFIGAGVYYAATYKARKQSPAKQTAFSSTVSQSNTLFSQKKYDENLAMWEKFLATNPSPDEQVRAYKEIASIQLNKNQDYAGALASYKKAEQLNSKPDYGLLIAMAAVAEQMKDTATAKAYYQKAINALDPKDQLYKANKTSLEKKVQELR